MRKIIIFAMLMASWGGAAACSALLDHEVRKLGEEETVSLCDYQGQVIVVVNTASRCGYTRQYASLEKLYSEHREQGLVVLGFPSNDFSQEPGTEEQIQSFCRLTYGVEFPMFAKSSVRGDAPEPIYEGLAEASGRYPQWNFHKYLIARDGSYVADFPSSVDPLSNRMMDLVERELVRKF